MLTGERNGSCSRAAFSASLRPPFEFCVVPDNRGVFRRHFKEKPIGIGLQSDVPMRVTKFKFVMRPFPTPGMKISQTPDTPSSRMG